MARSIVLSNGSLAVCLDDLGYVRDFYFPHVGLYNHVMGNKHRIGIYVNGVFSWLDDPKWSIKISYKPKTMVTQLIAKNQADQISLVTQDCVYNESNVFVRKFDIYNHSQNPAQIKLFFSQEFVIDEGNKRNTAFFDPTHNAIVHYKGQRVFIVNGLTQSGNRIDDYTVGSFQFEGKEGSYLDAEDGQLSRNGVEHGSADSVIRLCASCEGTQKTSIFYWICASDSLKSAYDLNLMVEEKTPEAILNSTENYWTAWLEKSTIAKDLLSDGKRKLFDVSLFVLRAHFDNQGGAIASVDSNMIQYGKDDYSYVWPRDAAFIATTLDRAGYTEITKKFFLFCRDVLHPDGYLHHRFRPDKSLGSTWHSTVAQKDWLKNKILQLPIQQDESAAVLVALWKHYQLTKDIEFIEMLYKPLIEKIAEFIVHFRDESTSLPLHSYDLWEEKIGVSTYTCACVYGGLVAAANFSQLLGKRNHLRNYLAVAKQIRSAAIKYLYSTELKSFIRFGEILSDSTVKQHQVVDASSLFGLWYFGMIDQTDPLFISTDEAVNRYLTNKSKVGGVIRYQNDAYFRTGELSNPWFITTMWRCQQVLNREIVSDTDFDFVKTTLDWVESHQTTSGVLGEQLDPDTGENLSATPLAWSHSVYVETVLMYLEKLSQVRLLRTQ